MRTFLLLSMLLVTAHVNAQVSINEFLAANNSTIQDLDGDTSDWIELINTSSNSIDLAGWHLTDDSSNLTKWMLPATNLAPYELVLIFASNKDRAISGTELHTNFKLSAGGEYLALVRPDGSTVEHEFSPTYPPQSDDISYGYSRSLSSITLVDENADCSAVVPEDASDGSSWQLPGYNDSTWDQGSIGVGYDTDSNPNYQPFINLDIQGAMYGENASAYIRVPFSIGSADNITELKLHLRYDDGFVAYINGTKVAETNAPAAPTWESGATGDQADLQAVEYIEFDISASKNALISGANILAIHGLNDGTSSPDFLMDPKLTCELLNEGESGNIGYLDNPSPNQQNTTGTRPPSAPVILSQMSRVCDAPITVTISSSTSVETIYYTLDGSVPDLSSLEYTNPISISGTTMVRARSFQTGYELGNISSETYLFLTENIKDFSSDLPIIILDNLGGNDIPSTEDTGIDQQAFMAIFEPGSNGRTVMTNQFTLGTRSGIIRRGSSSLRETDSKPSLKLEAWGPHLDEDFDIAPLGMPEESDWILWAPYNYDLAGIRNALIYKLDRQLNGWGIRTRFVEVFLNVDGGNLSTNHYNGLYVLMEKIKRGPDRTDVKSMTPFDIAAPDVTGGYLMKIDWTGNTALSGASQDTLFCEYPLPDQLTIEQKQYIENFVISMEGQLTNDDPETGYEQYIDVPSFLNAHQINVFAQNPDAFRISTYMSKNRNGKLTLGPQWDFDRTMESADWRDNAPWRWHYPNLNDVQPYFETGEAIWWEHLFDQSSFWQSWIDTWQENRVGVLSSSNVWAIIDSFSIEIAEARERDIARWDSIAPRTGSYGLDGTQQGEIDHMKWWVDYRLNWIDTFLLERPSCSVGEQELETPITAELTVPINNSVYYTLDDSDPRAFNGSPSSTAQVYTAPITVSPGSVLKARTWNGEAWNGIAPDHAPWSGLTEVVFPRRRQKLLLTEVHYNPAPDAFTSYDNDDFEFIEFQNISSSPLDISGYILSGGINFEFASGQIDTLAPGEHIVIVKNLEAFASRYDTNSITIAGTYSGLLANSGDNLELEYFGTQRFNIDYNDARGWPLATDGGGHSLVPLHNDALLRGFDIYDHWMNWKSSTHSGGSPGQADPAAPVTLLINEIIAHTDTGQAPPFDSNDSIELFNPTGNDMTLDQHWYLSDDVQALEKYNLPSGTIIPANGWISFNEDDFHPGRESGFGLNKAGEQVILSHLPGNALNRIIDSVEFNGQANGASWGRYPDGALYYQTLTPTPGAQNEEADPSILICEIMYNPSAITNGNANEWIEYLILSNASLTTVTFNGGVEATNAWRMNGGIDMDLDPSFSLNPADVAILVPFDPAVELEKKTVFFSFYSLPPSTSLLGPYSGDLSNSGERIRLERPQASDDPLKPEDLSWIIVDEATWTDESPWPAEADGTGHSLLRTGANGNAPENWSSTADLDADGIPDSYEQSYFAADIDPQNDWDGDGISNHKEWRSGTNPTNPSSRLAITELYVGPLTELKWLSESNKQYSISMTTNLTAEYTLLEAPISATAPTNSILISHPEVPHAFFKINVAD